MFVAEDLVEDHILHRLGLVSPGILQAAFEIQRVPVGPLVDRVAVDYGGTGGTLDGTCGGEGAGVSWANILKWTLLISRKTASISISIIGYVD